MAKAKVLSMFSKKLVKWFIKKVWPWIVKNVWPEIKKELTDIFEMIARKAKHEIIKWWKKRNNDREKTAKNRAKEAEHLAQNATTKSESEKYRAIAQVWREVADQFRQENELLKVKLETELKKATSTFQAQLDSMRLKEFIQEGNDASLTLKGSGTILQLPEP